MVEENEEDCADDIKPFSSVEKAKLEHFASEPDKDGEAHRDEDVAEIIDVVSREGEVKENLRVIAPGAAAEFFVQHLSANKTDVERHALNHGALDPHAGIVRIARRHHRVIHPTLTIHPRPAPRVTSQTPQTRTHSLTRRSFAFTFASLHFRRRSVGAYLMYTYTRGGLMYTVGHWL